MCPCLCPELRSVCNESRSLHAHRGSGSLVVCAGTPSCLSSFLIFRLSDYRPFYSPLCDGFLSMTRLIWFTAGFNPWTGANLRQEEGHVFDLWTRFHGDKEEINKMTSLERTLDCGAFQYYTLWSF